MQKVTTSPAPGTLLASSIAINNTNQLADVLQLKKLERHLTVDKAIEAPNLAQVSKDIGEARTVKLLYAIVHHYVAGFKAKRTMDQNDIIDFCSDYLDLRRTETLEDLILCLRDARRGLYGENYQTVDSLQLNKWFNQYLDIKLEVRERYLHNRKYKKDDTPISPDPEYIAKLKQIREQLDSKRVAPKEAKSKPGLEADVTRLMEAMEDMGKAELIKLAKEIRLAMPHSATGKELQEMVAKKLNSREA